MGAMDGKIAIVTGAGNEMGIGRAAALVFAAASASVVVADINDDGGRDTVALIEAASGTGLHIHADMAKTSDIQTMAVNLKGVWLCMKYEIPQMLASGGGAIVNTSSIAGLIGTPGLPAYTASKFGVVGLSKGAAVEFASEDIRVNCVNPGVVNTLMVARLFEENPEMAEGIAAATPLGRVGEPNEIADTVVWLCSDQASFVTGQALAVDGGYTTQ